MKLVVSLRHRVVLAGVALSAVVGSAHAQIIGTFPVAPFPPGNPTSAGGGGAAATAREELGKVLFWDEQLGHDRTMACGTCHAPERGGNDEHGGLLHPGFDGILGTVDDSFGSPGVVRQDVLGDYTSDPFNGVSPQGTSLNAPTMIGAAFFQRLFWDKRAGPSFKDLSGAVIPGFNVNAALEDQAAGPPANGVEMGHDGIQWIDIEQKLGALTPLALASNVPTTFPSVAGLTYQAMFDNAFGVGPITRQKVAMVLASYMRTLIPTEAPVVNGTMTAAQIRGLNLFRSEGCVTCHAVGGSITGTFDPNNPSTQAFDQANDKLFSDGRAHNIQLVGHNVFPPTFPDDGFGVGVKTPTLLNVALRKRFFHAGHMTSLTQTMTDQYNKTPPAQFGFSPPLTGTNLADFMDFMENALTDTRVRDALPPFDRPTLRADVVPFGANQVGPGSAGTGGLIPAMISNAPPKLGNSDFKFGVGRALPGALASLWFSPTLTPGQLLGGIPFELTRGTAQMLGVHTVSAAGTVTAHRGIGANPALLGVQLNFQWLVADPAAVGGFAASPAATFTVF